MRWRVCTVVGLILSALLLPSAAWAVDAVTSASPALHQAGGGDAATWIVGRGFQEGTTATISGDGILMGPQAPEVVLQANRVDGGLGDGLIVHFQVAANASNGFRDVTLTAPDGRTVTSFGLLRIDGGGQGAPDPDAGVDPPDMGDDPNVDAGVQQPPGQAGRVDVIARASPRFGAQGEQINLWIVGRSFGAESEVVFNVEGLGPTLYEGQPLAQAVHRGAETINGELYDGIQYYLRIPVDARPGFVDISVGNPDGSAATGAKLFEIVEPGMAPQPPAGFGNVDEITGASPRAVRAGRNAALWIWGSGFATGAEVTFSQDGIRQVAPAEVVESPVSNVGFTGLRAFVQVEGDTPPGGIDVSVRNPNGTVATASGLFDVAPAAGNNGGAQGPDGATGPCPDDQLIIEAIDAVAPAMLRQGEVVSLAIQGVAFGCGASVIIKGGGLRAVEAPHLVSDATQPLETTMFWKLQVDTDAVIGPRDVTVINPNNSARTLSSAFFIEAAAGRSEEVAFCAATPGRSAPLWPVAGFGLALLLLGRRRRR
jgi:hypothetical protein